MVDNASSFCLGQKATQIERASEDRHHGLQTLQGRCPALIASSRVLNACRLVGEILCAHLQSGRWNGSRVAEATYATAFCGGLAEACSVVFSVQPTKPLATSKAARASLITVFMARVEFLSGVSVGLEFVTSRTRTLARGWCRSRDS